MSKVWLKATATLIYEADPKHYGEPDSVTPEIMAAIDSDGDMLLILDCEETVFKIEPCDPPSTT